MTKIIEKTIRQYPDEWLWFQKRWNTAYTQVVVEQEISSGGGKERIGKQA